MIAQTVQFMGCTASRLYDAYLSSPSTVHKILARCQISRLSHVDRVTGESARRNEHAYPGSLLHVDVKSKPRRVNCGWVIAANIAADLAARASL